MSNVKAKAGLRQLIIFTTVKWENKKDSFDEALEKFKTKTDLPIIKTNESPIKFLVMFDWNNYKIWNKIRDPHGWELNKLDRLKIRYYILKYGIRNFLRRLLK